MTSLERLFGEQNRVHELEPIGVIDIGSNSVRFVVYEGAVRAPTPLFNEKVLCGLGRSIATTGKLGGEAVDRALAALARFRSIARILGVKNVRAFATAAVREAEDGARVHRARREGVRDCASRSCRARRKPSSSRKASSWASWRPTGSPAISAAAASN